MDDSQDTTDGARSFSQGSIPVHVLNADGTVRYVNDAWVSLTGHDRADAVGRPLADLVTTAAAERLAEQLAAGDDADTVSLAFDGPGTGVDVAHDVGVERDDGGQPHRYHCQCRPLDSVTDETASLLETFVDAIPAGIVVETGSREILAVNPALCDLFSLSAVPLDVAGADGPEFVSRLAARADEPTRLASTIEGCLEGGEPTCGDLFALADGRVVELCYLPVMLPAGEGHLWVYEDVTERTTRDTELRTYERLFDVAPVGIFRTTVAGSVLSVNQRLANMLGYDDEDALLSAYRDLGSDLYADPGRRETFLDRLRTTGVVEGFEYEAVAADGQQRWLSMNARLLPERVDDERVITGFTRDVTERKTRERDLRTYREVVQRLEDPTMVQDLDGRFVLVNGAVADYAGIPREELLGVDEYQFMDEETANRIDRMKARVLTTEQPVEYEVEPTFEQRGTRTFATLRYPYYDAADELAGTVAICRDITDQKQREQQLEVLGRVLRHNLRNAMTVVQGQAEMIATGETDDPAVAAERILDQADTLIAQSNKEQSVATILREASGRRVRDVPTLVDSAVQAVLSTFPTATVETECPESARARVCDRFEQALVELLDNAVRHHDGPTPTVSVSVERTDGHVTIAVADSGPGLPEVERDVLRGQADTTPLSHSTGIGLWLIQWLVHVSEGTVSVTDNDRGGATVVLRLPAAAGGNDFEGVP